jgi:Family of unknown function (DUF5320)
MPGGDRTGPMGIGSMTGKAAGYCGGHPLPDYLNSVPAKGFGFGFGRGRGRARGFSRGGGRCWRHWYYATGLPGRMRTGMSLLERSGYNGVYPYASELTPQQEADMLRERAKMMQQEINVINEQINVLEKAETEKKK